MPSINVYLSQELQQQMQALHPAPNWSRIAADAFERTIELERIRAVDTTRANIARLQASREKSEEKNHADGVQIGKTWALNVAEYDELERVVAMPHLDVTGDPFTRMASASRLLANAILGEHSPGLIAVRHLIEQLFGGDSVPVAKIEGFVEGVKEVFESIP
jgi:hypothetical protein